MSEEITRYRVSRRFVGTWYPAEDEKPDTAREVWVKTSVGHALGFYDAESAEWMEPGSLWIMDVLWWAEIVEPGEGASP